MIGNSDIRAGIGPGFLRERFGNKSLVACLIELIKNLRDWEATLGEVLTADRSRIQIFDNGNGMNKGNRDAFASINLSNASGERQHGKFDTGTKYMLFSFATFVEVRTACKDEPDVVYIFSFSTEEYEKLVMSGGVIKPKVVKKTKKTWLYMEKGSYGARFGTMLTYTFEAPGSRRIERGLPLAKMLAARLPLKFQDILRVDGKKIPDKKIVGEVFTALHNKDKSLGEVMVQCYRPEKWTSEEGLLLTGSEVGDASFIELYKLLGDERDLVPEILLMRKDVCGIISAPFLGEYFTESRDGMNPKILDDVRLLKLLKLLRKYGPSIQHKLRINIRNIGINDEFTEQAEINEVLQACKDRWPDDSPHGPPPTNGKSPAGPTGSADETNALGIRNKKQLEVGESDDIRVIFRKGLGDTYGVSDVRWNFNRPLGSVQVTPKGVRLTVDKVGDGYISVDLPGTLHSARAVFEVVGERELGISTRSYLSVEKGATIPIMALNADKVDSANLTWKHQGKGALDVSGAKAVFTADEVGSASVEVFDSSCPNRVRAVSEIQITPQKPAARTTSIRGVWFVVDVKEAEGIEAFRKPVTMQEGAGKYHRMILNPKAVGYEEARKKGIFVDMLFCWMAGEFARFAALDLEPPNLQVFDPRDMPQFFNQIQFEACQVLRDMMAKPLKKR